MLNQNEPNAILSHMDEIAETKKIEIRVSTDFSRTIPNCTTCGKEMQFVEGDIICGEKWYHNECAKSKSGGRTYV